MCGVFAVFSTGEPVELERVQAALTALSHRGPDGRGVWRSLRRDVALGHVRLAVRGNTPQPVRDGAGRAGIINGELYNAAPAGGASDSARLLPLIAEHGLDCVHGMRGEFAFIAWDAPNRRLIAARDPFGVKPLFCCVYGGVFLLASEVKAFAAYGVPLRWDEEALMSFLLTGMIPQHRTLFAGIGEVPPGHRLVVDAAGHRVTRWWQPVLSEAGGDAVRVAAIREGVAEAVSVRLASDRPIAVSLSGGVDSSLVCALAARQAPVLALSVGFGGPDDERQQASEFARALGVPFHSLHATEALLADAYAETVRAVEGPLMNTHAVARGLLAREARSAGRVVLLTGDGGDELFGGYPHFVQDSWRGQGNAAGFLRVAEDTPSTARFLLDSGTPSPQERLPGFVRARLADGAALRQLLSRDALARWDAPALLEGALESFALPPGLSTRGPVERAMVLWAEAVLPRYLLPALGDRVELMHGVEGRPPLLDAELAKKAGVLVDNQRVRGGRDKWALRQAARGVLPAALLERPKRAFMAPPIAGQAGPMHELLQDTLRSDAGSTLPVFSPLRLRMLLDLSLPEDDPVRAAALDPVLNVVLSLALLGRGLGVLSPSG